MNKLPSDWQIKTLNEVCFPSSSNIAYKDVKDKKGNYPIFGASGIVAYADFYSKEKECLGIVKDGSVGKIFLLPAKSSVISTLNYLENTDLSDIKYLYYFLHRINFSKYIKGSVIPHIYFRDYKKEKIPLPPLATQKQIARKLDYLFDKIDKALKLLNKNKEYIKKYRLSILKDAFEGKLIHQSKNWEIKTLGEVCEINPKNKLDDNLEVSFIPMNLILDKFQNKFSYEIKKWKDIKKGYTHLQNNCIALAKITPCFENGKCVILRNLKNGYGAGTTELIIILPNSKKIIIEYIFYFMNTQYFMEQGKRNFKGSVGQLRIGTDFITNFKIPIPPIEIQKEIVSILDKSFKSMDEIEILNNENINNLLLLKKSLLKEAFSGRLI